MTWPRGVPRKGYKESGMPLVEWIGRHNGSIVVTLAQKKVDKTPAPVYEYYCRKDMWGRVFISILDSAGMRVGISQVRGNMPITQAYEMSTELKL